MELVSLSELAGAAPPPQESKRWLLVAGGSAALLFVLAAGRLWPVPLLITGAILLSGAALAGVLSIGMLLVPGALAAVAALGPTRRPQAGHSRAGMPAG